MSLACNLSNGVWLPGPLIARRRLAELSTTIFWSGAEYRLSFSAPNESGCAQRLAQLTTPLSGGARPGASPSFSDRDQQ